MVDKLSSQAIDAAITGNWELAVRLNLEILKTNPSDIEAFLRLGRSYEELGKITRAKKYLNLVLKQDKFNPIARRNLVRLKDAKNPKGKPIPREIKKDLFLEEPGETKTINLIKLGRPEVISKLHTAEELSLNVGKCSICLRDKNKNYLGRLPDDLSQRLIKLIKGGNQYLTVVKAVDSKLLQVFIKEVKKGKNTASIPSFPPQTDFYHSFLPQEVFKDEA